MPRMHCPYMTTMAQRGGDIFTIRPPPGAREGDVIEVLDANNRGHRMRLYLPMGEEFTFVWADLTGPEAGARFIRENGEWLIKVEGNHVPGDMVRVTSTKGVQEHKLGESVGEGLFRPVKRNHFKLNPTGDNPKWCVQVHDRHKAGDTVDVAKADRSTQRHQLVSEVQPNIWTTKKV